MSARWNLAALIVSAAPLLAQSPPPPATPATPAAAAPQRLPADSADIARRFARWMHSTRFDSLWPSIAPGMQQQLGSAEQMMNQWLGFSARVGTETELVEERWVRRNGQRQYWRVARFSDYPAEPVVLRLVIGPDGMLHGIGMNPLSQVPPIDAEP